MEQYNPKEIESKWQRYWEEHKTFSTPDDATIENKCYILPQLPYPSGSGLHVGHAEVYTACDIYARYQRMKGKKVLQVFGLDSFGLPAENYAIKTNVHPSQTIDESGANFVSQVKALGASVDWDRFVRSSDPSYYKFTQWFFLLMYERGLAYRKKQAVNWCESCKTVLANEQVADGHCERCSTEIIQKEMEQWYLRITDYADKLLEGLDRIDWPEETKKRQKDWIGRSEGCEVDFALQHSGTDARDKVTVFTTRPDTLFGVTFLVLAPEGQYVQGLKSGIENWDEVQTYIDETAKKTDLDRQVNQEKTGVELKGVKAINPANGEEIPVWIADYVIATYGTGAIMAVPAHDERDFAFAKKFEIEVKEVVAKQLGDRLEAGEERKSARAICVRDGKMLLTFNTIMKEYILPGGGIENFETPTEAVLRELAEETGYVNTRVVRSLGAVEHNYFHNYLKKNCRSIVHSFFVELLDEETVNRTPKEIEKTEFMWLPIEEAKEKLKKNARTFTREIEFISRYEKNEDTCFSDYGVVIHSDFLNGLTTEEATSAMIDWLEKEGKGKRKIQYKLRDWSVSRQRFWGAPLPMLSNEEYRMQNAEYSNSPERVIHVHAWGANSQSHFRNWLRTEEETLGIESITPSLPNAEMPDREQWKATIAEVVTDNTENTVLTGRSLGAFTALEIAGQQKFRKLVLIAPTLPIPEWKEQFARAVSDLGAQKKVLDFVQDDLDYSAIEKNCGEIVVFLSTNDPYIPLQASEQFLREKFPRCRIVCMRQAGHFGSDDGFDTFPELLEEIKREVRLDLQPAVFSDLPVILPNDVDFKPTGQSPLTYSPSFQDGVEEKYGKGWKREVNTLDTFMCSSWYFFRYLDPHNEEAFASPEALKKWMPVDFYLGGAEHVNGHLLYARFFTKVLFDAGYIDFDEPFTVHRHQGLILGPDGRKMSKRWGNVVNPTDVVEQYGADTMRMYEMFMGPLEEDKPWDENGVRGVRRFLDRVWNLQERLENGNFELEINLERKLQQTIKKVGDDLDSLGFNTAIAKLMELVNEMYKSEKIPVTYYELFITLLAPFAPHVTEELWSRLGHTDMLAFVDWPTYDESKLVSDTMNIAVQVNGKLRATVIVASDATEEGIKAQALAEENVIKWMEGKEPKKVIYVAGKIVSVVV
jgi:leucyl-tRNA synthetase